MKKQWKWFDLWHFVTNLWMVQSVCKSMLNKINGFIRVYDKAKYLQLFCLEKYDTIYDRIRYLISLKSGITYVFLICYAKIKIDLIILCLVDFEKTLILYNVIILIKSVLNEGQNHYYHKRLLEKWSYQLA